MGSNASEATFFSGANAEIFRRARELRKNQTTAEQILWEKLRGKRINGIRFRRQHPISNFIVDFYCHQKKLIIEVDGGIHRDKNVNEKDECRTIELEKLGLTVIRFTNEEIETNIGEVICKIKSLCPTLHSSSGEGSKLVHDLKSPIWGI